MLKDDTPDPAGSLRQPERRQDPARDDAAQVRARDQHRLGGFPAAAEGRTRVRDRLLLLRQPEGAGAVRRHVVQEGSGRQGLDLHRVRGRRGGGLVAEQGPVARRSREDGDQRRDPQRPDRRLERQVRGQDRSRRRLHALGLAGAVPDQQLQRVAEHRQLRPLRGSPRRSAARLLRPARAASRGRSASSRRPSR